MFFKFIKDNSKRSRKENGIYFASLVISIVAFYIILSLKDQNVIKFLERTESNAVGRLLSIISVLYFVSLFFMFFLTYFANKYQMENPKKQFGLLLIMGMKRSKLFTMIFLENLLNGIIALIIGLPFSILLTEIISLGTSKVVGIGLIGYSFSISFSAIALTSLGFIIVQILAILILSMNIINKEPKELMDKKKEDIQSISSKVSRNTSMLIGMISLGIAYFLGIFGLNGKLMGFLLRTPIGPFAFLIIVIAIFIFGIFGTFTFFKGLGNIIGKFLEKKSGKETGLYIFTRRQLQENVLKEYSSLAISSLLILMAILCFALGISVMTVRGRTTEKTTDFTFVNFPNGVYETIEEAEKASEIELDNIEEVLSSKELKPYVKNYYPMKFGRIDLDHKIEGEIIKGEHSVDWTNIINILNKEKDSNGKDNILANLENNYIDTIISLESYNELLKSMRKEEIVLKDNEIASYSSSRLPLESELWEKLLSKDSSIKIDGEEYKLKSGVHTENIVSDKAITISYAFIMPEKLYNKFVRVDEEYDTDEYWNMNIKPEIMEEKGELPTFLEIDNILENYNVNYESYANSIGRDLIMTVAGSYTSIYMGIIFLIIANTVLGIKFLIGQRSTAHRYKTISTLGAKTKAIKKSARKQIWYYFTLVISMAIISSYFGIKTLMGQFFYGSDMIKMERAVILAIIAVIVFIIIEFIYIIVIQRKSNKEVEKFVKFN